jgi:hypothetical protein
MSKHLHKFSILNATAAAVPMGWRLCDYLLYYPFVDMGTNDEQVMTNAATLPRYVDGEDVRIVVVMTNPQVTGGQTFSLSYTNQNGVAGRTTVVQTTNNATAIGSVLNAATATAGANGPFVPLQAGDTGVRSVESMTFLTGTDVGLASVVLVRPIASGMLRGIDAPVEVDFLTDRPSLPRFYDGAFLNILAFPNGSFAAAPFHGDMTIIWS